MNNFNFNFNFIKNGAPIVTLNSLGIAFNSLAITYLGNPEMVNIGFDEEKLTIGVTPCDENSVFPIFEFKSKEKNGWIRIGCKDFIKYLSTLSKIDFISKSRQFIATYNSDENILIVTIDKEHLKN